MDSRPTKQGVRRRYICGKGHRFSTLEQIAVPVQRYGGRVVTAHDETLSLAQWAAKLCLTVATLVHRLDVMKLPPEKALSKKRFHVIASQLKVVQDEPTGGAS